VIVADRDRRSGQISAAAALPLIIACAGGVSATHYFEGAMVQIADRQRDDAIKEQGKLQKNLEDSEKKAADTETARKIVEDKFKNLETNSDSMRHQIASLNKQIEELKAKPTLLSPPRPSKANAPRDDLSDSLRAMANDGGIPTNGSYPLMNGRYSLRGAFIGDKCRVTLIDNTGAESTQEVVDIVMGAVGEISIGDRKVRLFYRKRSCV
jgi:hypothetical protein